MTVESQPIRLYPERPGANLAPMIETLRKPAEFTLSEQERASVLEKEAILTRSNDLNHDLFRVSSEPVQGVEHIYNITINSTDFYLDYFLTEEGRQALQKFGVNDENAAKVTSLSEVRTLINGIDFSTLTGTEIGEIERKSKEFIQQRTVQEFEADGFNSVDNVQNPEKHTIVRNPEKLAQKAEGLRKLKNYLRSYKASLRDNADPNDRVSEAMKVMVTIHSRRVNELLAQLYPYGKAYLEQVESSGDRDDFAERIVKAMPPIDAVLGEEGARSLSRLDMFLNGAGEMKGGNYHQISSIASELADRISGLTQEAKPEEYKYQGLEDKWKDIDVSAEELLEWGNDVLEERGIKSAYADYDPDRSGRAPDGLWQAVIEPSATSFSVDSKLGAWKFPGKGRNIAQIAPAGAVPVLDHEETHVTQVRNMEKLGLSITEKVRMDRSPLIAEAGGIMVEIASQRENFGQVRPINADYLRAAQAILAGGGYRECFKAFFDSQMTKNPNANKKRVAEQAADRAMRLFRNGGQTNDNSGKLTHSGGGTFEYLEQELLAQEIRGTDLEPIFYLTGVNIEVLSELHRIGMFEISDLNIPDRRASDIVRDKIDKKLGVI